MINSNTEKSTIWSRNFICVLIANSLLVLSHNSVNTLVSTYATYLGAGPRVMGLLTGMFFWCCPCYETCGRTCYY